VFSLGLHRQQIGPNCWILGKGLFTKKHEDCHPTSFRPTPQAAVNHLGTGTYKRVLGSGQSEIDADVHALESRTDSGQIAQLEMSERL
jgi:hypothetical protein